MPQNLLIWQANIFTDFYYITLFSQIETDLAQLESTETLTECVLHIFFGNLRVCIMASAITPAVDNLIIFLIFYKQQESFSGIGKIWCQNIEFFKA